MKSIHQICHKDGESSERLVKDNEKLEGKHKPGNCIIPLDSPRTIYVCTPMIQVTAQKGQFVWFHGALPHGGMTHEANETGTDWRPAIHGLLDSSHHVRTQGYFDFESSEDICFPVEHSKFLTDLFPILDKGEDITHTALQEIMACNTPNCDLTEAQAMRCNHCFVGRHGETLNLLSPIAPKTRKN
jgi:hypothetical protein